MRCPVIQWLPSPSSAAMALPMSSASPYRPSAVDGGDHVLDLGRVAEQSAGEVGRGRAGRDGVDGDLAGAELLREVAGEDLDGALAGGVDEVLWNVEAGDAARDVDDRAAVDEQRCELLRQEERSFEHLVDERVEVGLGGIGEGSRPLRAAVVDEEVEGRTTPGVAERSGHGGDELVEAVDGSEVERKCDG